MKNQEGFTMIELLVYIGLTSILITLMSQIFLATLGVRIESQSAANVQQDSRFVMSRIAYDLHRASSIVSPTLGQVTSTLTLVITENGVDQTYTYATNGTSLQLTVGGESTLLHSSETDIGSLTFRRIGNSETQSTSRDTVQTTITFIGSEDVSAGQQAVTMQSTAGLR